MTPELGQIALILALGLAALLGTLSLWGAWRQDARWMALARPLAAGQFAFVALAFALLVHAFVVKDFSVAYVAHNANSLLPLPYRVAATWGGHEGSLLLWQLMLAGWTLAVARFSRQLPPDVVARVLGVLGLVGVGFLSFTLLTSNPFDRSLPAPADGRDLNPLLQDPGMVFHPPLLYMGYVGFSVAFAFAIAALISGRLDATWARWTRPWTLAAWAFLTLGILLGSFWAYYELGWGGWWFWDAVENASFMPWLVGTALVHSLSVSEKRDSFKHWTVLLAILAFSLSLLGTFLVRSGVLSSVHAFASDPRRGLFILAFLVVVIGGSLGLYAWRASAVAAPHAADGVHVPRVRFAAWSRESLLLLNNVFLLVTAGTVLLGTLYPLALDAFGLGKISVGPPYFEAVFVPLMVPVLVLMVFGPVVAWQRGSWSQAWQTLRAPALLAVALAGAVAVVARASLGVALGLLLSLWIVLGTLQLLRRRWVAVPGQTAWLARARALPLGLWGMAAAHLGVGVFVAGVTLVKGFDHAQDASLKEGDHVVVAGHDVHFASLAKGKGANYISARATFEVTRDGRHVATLHPEKRLYIVQRMPMTEAAIDRGFTRDLYVSLGEASPDGAWGVRVQVKPFMGWVWAGCLLMALGGGLAASDRRYRQRVQQAQVGTGPATTSSDTPSSHAPAWAPSPHPVQP
ncbi:cytochrome c-type biogenesis protein CcmF [Aquabacterium commune]|uniref:Cytochrome c-type biogenesis protein CcmF n=1 Tax=Aquabacterium commune TaxID=70586 RepID=A0A4R6RMU9_9BURK|nr:heme lyase CcmF/NrfE family subunit [Aquabacterium commune]TDP88031.1 cytochrome c-type biogenesis protein CcmF [Aquabacterium commune]